MLRRYIDIYNAPHLGLVHLALDQSVRQSVGLRLQLVNLLPQQTILIFQPL